MLMTEARKPIDDTTPLSGEVFGALINLSGRRRFTSQRIVLYAVLAAQGDDSASATAREALGLFRGAHAALINGDGKVPGIFCAELQEAYFGALAGDRKIRYFADLAERVLTAIERTSSEAAALLAELVGVTTPMLGVLNQVTAIYEDQSKRHAVLMKKQLRGVITDIETIAKQARMVAFNARIVAARAGQAGKEFAVVAGVLSTITGEIDDMVKAALSAA
ncbi:methyl-accepting chemotaxis protein [Janthinobacterium agaricidamnosum]|uniref:Methyl-accepting chemotaxis protein n=1 Tax=Janthinobacterium agaricidamnosum NBRC 102515 = DSM 9628 TaxID=1349767 RepID=W0V449_9BURK|nr:methyl-accepting chemotaxis protein [Janthinobacterium agaricidamnosum]CDG83604.1 methyl-accepting chemotaxis protein [Janthinobacterium agaricidamnosum NBRC 102515 = DSM 9628]